MQSGTDMSTPQSPEPIQFKHGWSGLTESKKSRGIFTLPGLLSLWRWRTESYVLVCAGVVTEPGKFGALLTFHAYDPFEMTNLLRFSLCLHCNQLPFPSMSLDLSAVWPLSDCHDFRYQLIMEMNHSQFPSWFWSSSFDPKFGMSFVICHLLSSWYQ
jgi:hypothetical protein